MIGIPMKTIKLVALVVVGYLVVRWLMNRGRDKGPPYTKEGSGATGAPAGIWV